MTADGEGGPGDENGGEQVARSESADQNAGWGGSSRRGFLKGVAAGTGAGLVGLLTAGEFSLDTHNDKQIVYAYARRDPADPASTQALTKRVPAEWYHELKYAVNRHRQLPWNDITGVVGSFVIPGDFSEPRASVAVQSTTPDVHTEINPLLPDIDLEIELIDDLGPFTDESTITTPNTVANLESRAVPGGVFCRNEDLYGSLAPALYDHSADKRFFATSNHLYRQAQQPEHGHPLYLVDGDAQTTVGHVHQSHPAQDLALVEPAGEYVPRSEISTAMPGTVAGQFTRIGLADLQARGEPLEMVGAVSGHATGEIEAIDGVTFYAGHIPKTGQIKWGDQSTLTDGDSGSVNYHRDPKNTDRLLIGGINNARTWWPGADYAWGTAAYHIRNVHGYTF